MYPSTRCWPWLYITLALAVVSSFPTWGVTSIGPGNVPSGVHDTAAHESTPILICFHCPSLLTALMGLRNSTPYTLLAVLLVVLGTPMGSSSLTNGFPLSTKSGPDRGDSFGAAPMGRVVRARLFCQLVLRLKSSARLACSLSLLCISAYFLSTESLSVFVLVLMLLYVRGPCCCRCCCCCCCCCCSCSCLTSVAYVGCCFAVALLLLLLVLLWYPLLLVVTLVAGGAVVGGSGIVASCCNHCMALLLLLLLCSCCCFCCGCCCCCCCLL